MSDPINGWSRRSFLSFIGSLGGSMAVHEVATAMGWLADVGPAYAGPPRLPAGSGEGKSVVILGAGIGGLTTAYELIRAGYRVAILEPQMRAGGRSLTARPGTEVVEESTVDGRKRETTQTCAFDEGLYLNLGPGRLPYHHRRVLHYCRELGVPLEVYNMTTTANLWQRQTAFDGKPQLRRQLEADAMGYIAELLAKQVCRGATLDISLTEQERRQLLDLLVVFGDLNGTGTNCAVKHDEQLCSNPKAFEYCGSTRAGCAELDIAHTCSAPERIPIRKLLASQFWNGDHPMFYQPLSFEWQPTLFQPVGGMDQIVKGFLRRIEPVIRYGVRAERVTIEQDRVLVEATDLFRRRHETWTANFCISNMPLPLLQEVTGNFSEDYRRAILRGRFQPACKVGWQANERFWENDENQIYGGISYIEAPITQIWYPSYDYFTQKGTLTGAYNYEGVAEAFGRLLPEQRLAQAREQGARLHRQIADDRIVPIKKGISIAWQNIPYQRGGWAEWNGASKEDRDAYARLLAPDRGRFFVVGDQISPLPGWQEGAMMSAEHVVQQIGGKRPLTVPEIEEAPHTRRLILGTRH